MAFLADCQTKGRGTRGRVWNSPAGWTYLSIALPPAPREATELSLLVAQTVRDIVWEQYPATADLWIKPPNDVYRGQDKIVGILLEQMKDALIVGVGIDYPPDTLAFRVVEAIESLYTRWLADHSSVFKEIVKYA